MNFTISGVKDLLLNTIGKDFLNDGYSFSKSSFEFSKKVDKNKIRYYFMFYNYAPYKIEYQFSVRCTIQEIEAEKKLLYNFIGKPYTNTGTFRFREGDFHPMVRNESMKFRAAFTHTLTNDPTDALVIEDSRVNLKREFFSREPIFSNLEAFQNFILEDFSRPMKYVGTWASLIALKLRDDSSYLNLLNHIKQEIGYEYLDPSHTDKKLLDNIMRFYQGQGS